MKYIAPFILFVLLYSCKEEESVKSLSKREGEYSEFINDLYFKCDTVIRTKDTLKILNSKFDTIIIETGIFTYLHTIYPVVIPRKLVHFSKRAVLLDNLGRIDEAKAYYKKVIDFYNQERPECIKEFSDMNWILQFEITCAILCSYAYERCSDFDSAINTLRPFLANSEVYDCKIQQRYIELCVTKYGMASVKTELDNCGKTLHFRKVSANELDDWVVTVFGADIGVGNSFVEKTMTISQAENAVKKMNFYKTLLKHNE